MATLTTCPPPQSWPTRSTGPSIASSSRDEPVAVLADRGAEPVREGRAEAGRATVVRTSARSRCAGAAAPRTAAVSARTPWTSTTGGEIAGSWVQASILAMQQACRLVACPRLAAAPSPSAAPRRSDGCSTPRCASSPPAGSAPSRSPRSAPRRATAAGIVSHHFGSRQALMDAVARDVQRRFAPHHATGTGLERVLGLVDAYLAELEARDLDARVFLVLWTEAIVERPGAAPVFAERDEAFRQGGRTRSRAGVADGSIRSDADEEAAARRARRRCCAASACSGCSRRRPSTSTPCAPRSARMLRGGLAA